ncbi:MAG: hypothetical protein K2Q32_08025 [Alphaproteobacteria bacterium]|nr:hypothetical protein [Alphaproteobacteria bacterium]
MAISVFPTYQTRLMRERIPGKLVRLSGTNSPYAVELQHDAATPIGVQITPIFRSDNPASERLPGPSFSAQLLELGLKHNVDGLIQKANEQLTYQGAEPHSAQKNAARHYERAQDNFARDSLHMVERQY